MPAQTQLSENQAMAMAAYILTLAGETSAEQIPLTGALTFDQHEGKGLGSSYLLRASYEDKGTADGEPIRREASFRFRSPRMEAEDLDMTQSSSMEVRGQVVRAKAGDYLAMGKIDFNGLRTLAVGYRRSRGAILSVHAGSPENAPIGQVSLPESETGEHQVQLLLDPASLTDQLYLKISDQEGNAGESVIVVLDYIEFLPPEL